MHPDIIEVQGDLLADGTLKLDAKVPLPAGRVRLRVEPLPRPAPPDASRFWGMMRGIWDNLRDSAWQPRTREEIDAEIEALREEAEDELRAVERLHEQCEQARRGGAKNGSGHGVP